MKRRKGGWMKYLDPTTPEPIMIIYESLIGNPHFPPLLPDHKWLILDMNWWGFAATLEGSRPWIEMIALWMNYKSPSMQKNLIFEGLLEAILFHLMHLLHHLSNTFAK